MELKKYYEFICDVWTFIKKYKKPLEYDSYWEVLMNEADSLVKKHGNTTFVMKIMLCVIDEIERIYLEER